MKILSSLLLMIFSFCSLAASAAEAITFKQPFSVKMNWLNYGITIVILLLIIALFIAKRHKPHQAKQSLCQLVEKKYLGNKTVLYVIDYQQKRFLLADNQQALAIHELPARETDEKL